MPKVENTMSRWSFSRLQKYENCPLQVKLQYLDKIPGLPTPPDAPNARGTRIHDECDQYITSKLPNQTPDMARHFENEFAELRALHKLGQVTTEYECGVTQDWEYVPNWAEPAWSICKMDAEVIDDPESPIEGRLIDFKTGRKRYSQVKHGEQLQFYQTIMFAKHPTLERIITELWYLDEGKPIGAQKFTRKQGEKFIRGFKNRGTKMMIEDRFRANPNNHSCRFCDYGPGKTYDGRDKLNICAVGVELY